MIEVKAPDFVCPNCGAHQQFEEWASRPTIQPFQLEVAETGALTPVYAEFDYGDDTEDESVVCRGCHATWSDVTHLELHMRAAQAYEALRPYEGRQPWIDEALALLVPYSEGWGS